MTEADPARLAAIHEAIVRWRALAAAARHDSRSEQRRLGLEVLHIARHLAAGLDSLQRLEQQHRLTRQSLAHLDAAVSVATERLGKRIGVLRSVHDIADRRLQRQPATRASSGLVARRDRADELLATSRTSLLTVERSARELRGIQERHERVGTRLTELRDTLVELLAGVQEGRDLLIGADRLLAEIEARYEAAHLGLTDLFRVTADHAGQVSLGMPS